MKNTTAHIIYLSDLHFGTADKAALWADQLVHDITAELKCPERAKYTSLG